jgi:hypothetical protein
MKMHNYKNTFFWALMFSWSVPGFCQNSPSVHAVETDEQKTVEMVWGDLKLPLTATASSTYFKVKKEITREEAMKLITQPIQFLLNGKPYFLSGLIASTNARKSALTAPNDTVVVGAKPKANKDTEQQEVRTSSQPLIGGLLLDSLVDQKKYIFNIETQKDLLAFLKEGNRITFGTSRNRPGLMVNIDIDIFDPYELFRPRYYVPPMSYIKPDISPWQWASVPGRKKGIVRYDPNHATHVKIIAAYSNEEKYELIPIPGFQTGAHYVGEEDFIVPLKDVSSKDTLRKSPVLDAYKGYDMITEMSVGWSIQWGSVEVGHKGKYCKPEEFNVANLEKMMVKRGQQLLPIEQVLITITQKEGNVSQYLISGQEPEVWQTIFQNLPPSTSIYFEEIIVREADEKLYRVQIPFILNVW